jgi:hypothetical protein
MDRWAWSQLEPWRSIRRQLPVGPLLCVIRGATAGRQWESSSARKQLARTARHHLDLSPGIDSSEIIDTVHSRPAPVIAATAGLGSMF